MKDISKLPKRGIPVVFGDLKQAISKVDSKLIKKNIPSHRKRRSKNTIFFHL